MVVKEKFFAGFPLPGNSLFNVFEKEKNKIPLVIN